MDVITPPETRGRSRSRTPFLRSSCDRESCTHLGEGHVHERKTKKSPQVQTIIEESFEARHTPDRQFQQKSSSSRTVKASKVITSDYSSDDISPENSRSRDNVKSVTITTTTETITSGGTHSSQTKNASSSSSSATSRMIGAGQVMSPIDKPHSKEFSQNAMMNSAFEASIKTSTPINSGNNSSRRIKFASSTVTNGKAVGDHKSYEEYKAAGDYWNKYPKTDYTYSRLSPHRREIAPGVVAMPNMSRKSLDQHHERIEFLIQQNPAQESYIRQRYADERYTTSRRTTKSLLRNDLQYDSQDELDTMSHFNAFDRQYRETIVTRILTTIVTIFHTVTAGFWRSGREVHYGGVEKKTGFFGSILSRFSSLLVTAFRPVYVLISSMLFADTLLLRSANPDNRAKKRFLLVLLLLLPLLLLGGLQYYLNPNYTFPPVINITSYTLPSSFNDIKVGTSEKYELLKAGTVEKMQNLVNLSEDYFDYLKVVSQNMMYAVEKLWVENFN